MSELIQKNESHHSRWKLLAEVSALALMGYVATMPVARAEDNDRPTVWIELGGQLSRIEANPQSYAPPFVALTPSNITPPQEAEKPARWGMDESAAIVFQPIGSDWTFSASLRYGRSGNAKRVHEQSSPAPYTAYLILHRSRNGVIFDRTSHQVVDPIAARFADAVTKQDESHTILDFQAGRDLGIGLFSHGGSSILNVGVRFAQFTSRARANLKENPDWQFKTYISTFHTSYDYGSSHYSFSRRWQRAYQPFHSFAGTFLASRSFSGLGPSISWNSSEQLLGHPERGVVTFDWGVNAALLFGRQKTKVHHQTTALFHSTFAALENLPISYQRSTMPDRARSRSVIVPNVGAFAGFSVKYPNAKVSFGYKADFFFGAMDGGIDVRRTEDVGFHGPYASISIGLGG